MATSIGSSWSLESLRGEKGMKPMAIEGAAGSTMAERATAWWAGSRTVLKVAFALSGVLVIVGASLGIVAATGGFASSPPSPPVYAMGMRPIGQKKSGTAGRRMEETDSSNLYTEFTCDDASMIDDLSINFMSVNVPGEFDKDMPGGMMLWDWKKSNADVDRYNFDDPMILVQAGATDLILNNNSTINSQDELVKEMRHLVSWSRPNSSTGLMGCTSLEEYASNGEQYVCGPYDIHISYANNSIDAHIFFPIFPAMSEFIAGNYTHGVLDFNAKLKWLNPSETEENTGCDLHARFKTYNPKGTNSSLYTRRVSNEDYVSPPTHTNPSFKYDERFPGQGWSFDNGAWTRPNYTAFYDFFNGVHLTSGQQLLQLAEFVKGRIATTMEGGDDIKSAWKFDLLKDDYKLNGSITPGVKIMHKLYFESYGSLFQNWMQHYIKALITGYRKKGVLVEKPKNIGDELWKP